MSSYSIKPLWQVCVCHTQRKVYVILLWKAILILLIYYLYLALSVLCIFLVLTPCQICIALTSLPFYRLSLYLRDIFAVRSSLVSWNCICWLSALFSEHLKSYLESSYLLAMSWYILPEKSKFVSCAIDRTHHWVKTCSHFHVFQDGIHML